MSDNISRLKVIDMRLTSLRIYQKDSPEIARMIAAREDVFGRLTPKELDDLARGDRPKTRAELAAEAEAERIAMEANRDRPSI
jgi:regulator of protease activity HflC (stomatin/prohibitin superfamily)